MAIESTESVQQTGRSRTPGLWAWLRTRWQRFRQLLTTKGTSSTLATAAAGRSSEGPTGQAGSISDEPASPDEFDDLTLPSLQLHLVKRHDQLLQPDIYELAMEMVKTNPLSEPKGAMIELAAIIGHPRAALLVIEEDSEYAGIALVEVGFGLVSGAGVLHFLHRGSDRARRALVDAVKVFAEFHGAKRIFGVDMNNKARAFKKLFGQVGPATEHGQLVEFKLTEDD